MGTLPGKSFALVAMGCLGVAVSAFAQDQMAIKGGRIVTLAGAPIDGGIILIRNGRITAVGKDLSIPVEATVIEAAGKVILPGFVEAHSSSGMAQSNEVNPNVPFLSVMDTIDPSREYFEECRRNGVTTVAVVPGNATMIGGQAAVMKTAGTYVDEMVMKRHAGMKISLSGSSSRMSHYARLRRELQHAKNVLDGIAESAETKAESPAENRPAAEAKTGDQPETSPERQNVPDPAQNEAQRAAMTRLLKGENYAFIYCANGMDVLQALQLIDTYKLKAILVLGRETYQAVDQISASKLKVILDETLVYWRTDERTGKDEKIVLPKIFRDHGVPFTFQVSGATASTLGNSYLWYQAATAVKYGTPVDEALRSITLLPAEMLGVSDLVGSIEPNKDADLVILNGDPLKVTTWVETTIVNGRVVYERHKDAKLKRLLQEAPQ